MMQFLVNDAVLARLSCVSLSLPLSLSLGSLLRHLPARMEPRARSPRTRPSRWRWRAALVLSSSSSRRQRLGYNFRAKSRRLRAKRPNRQRPKLSSPSRDANPPSALYIGRGHHPRVCTVGLVIPPFFICIIAALIRPRERVSRERKRESLSPPPPGDIGRTVRITFLSPQPP